MPCPPEIVASFESVVDIYFSAVRHRDRAAFILCDNLVEMACKTKAHQHNRRFDRSCSFHAAVTAPGVTAELTDEITDRLLAFRNTRNDLQHQNAAGTIDPSLCADAIGYAYNVVNRLWPGTVFAAKLTCGFRLARLYETNADRASLAQVEGRMARYSWRTRDKESVRVSAVQIEPGVRDHWGYALLHRYTDVNAILDEVVGLVTI